MTNVVPLLPNLSSATLAEDEVHARREAQDRVIDFLGGVEIDVVVKLNLTGSGEEQFGVVAHGHEWRRIGSKTRDGREDG